MFDFPPNVYTYIGLCAVVASATFVVALLIHNWIKLKRAIRESESYQSEVHRWALECFGRECVMDTAERNMRFAEEAMELVQACGMPRRAAHAMVDWVYERPAGTPFAEVGGVMTTLTALCTAHGVDLDRAAYAELRRVWKQKDKIIAAQKNKLHLPNIPERNRGARVSTFF